MSDLHDTQPVAGAPVAAETAAFPVVVDRISELYNGEIFTSESAEVARNRIHWMCSQCAGKTVLDIGCSQGIATILLAREGFHVIGLDVHPDALAYAREATSRETPAVQARIRWVEQDLIEFSPDAAFDSVLLGETIEHQAAPQRFLARVVEMAKPGGRVILTTPFGLHPHEDHKATLVPRQLVEMADEIGMEVSSLEVVDGYHRLVLTRPTGKPARRAIDDRYLLKCTEEGLLASQYELFQRLQDRSSALGQARKDMEELRRKLGPLQRVQQRFREALVLCEDAKRMFGEFRKAHTEDVQRWLKAEAASREVHEALARHHDEQMKRQELHIKSSLPYRLGQVLVDYGKPFLWPLLWWRLYREWKVPDWISDGASAEGGGHADTATGAHGRDLHALVEVCKKRGPAAALKHFSKAISTHKPVIRARELLRAGLHLSRAGQRDADVPFARAAVETHKSEITLRGYLHAALRARAFLKACDALIELEALYRAKPTKELEEFLGKWLLSPVYTLSVLKRVKSSPVSRIESIQRRVCYVLHNTLPYSSGGYATRSHGVAAAIQQAGWDVIALSRPGYPVDIRPDLQADQVPDTDTVDGVRYVRTLAPLRTGHTFREYILDAADAIEARLREYRPSMVMAASNYVTGLPALIAARRLGLPFVYEIRGLWEITRMSRETEFKDKTAFHVQKILEGETAERAEHVFTLTEAMREELIARKVPASKITLLPNSVDVTRFAPRERDYALASSLGIPSGVPVIGYIGTFVDYEGLEDLAAAAALLAQRNVDFRLMLVGNENASGQDRGPISAEIERIASESQLKDKLIMVGRVPHDRVASYYSLIDICPFPRKPWPVCEMVSPLKPLEAMAMSKSVVVSSVRALAEMVRDGANGLVFEKGNVDSLASVLERLAGDPQLRAALGMAGRAWVEEHRTWLSTTRMAVSVYEAILQAQLLESVELQAVSVSAPLSDVRAYYANEFGEKSGKGVYGTHDWHRLQFVFDRLRSAPAFLDVGVGAGQFINAVAGSGRFQSVTGVDVTTHSKFRRTSDAYKMKQMSVTDLKFPDRHFDAVTCMEVLEHIDRESFLKALQELRRVCRGQLIMTVPYNESVPLSSGHLQRFSDEDIRRFWPNARRTILKKPGLSWMLLEEDRATP